MKTSHVKICLVSLSMVIAGSACADWISAYEDEKATQYFDSTTVRKKGNKREVWQLYDFKKQQNNGVVSIRFKSEFDCSEARLRQLSITAFYGHMASGEVHTATTREGAWSDIPPSTPAASLLEALCT